MNKNMCCTLAGPGPTNFSFADDRKSKGYIELKGKIRGVVENLVTAGVTVFFTGMARGVETWAAEAVIEVKAKYKNVKLVAVLPCETQANNWPEEDREIYFNTLPKCDDVMYISTHFTPTCMYDYRRYMIDHSDNILAVNDVGVEDIDSYSVRYAQASNCNLILIPNTYFE